MYNASPAPGREFLSGSTRACSGPTCGPRRLSRRRWPSSSWQTSGSQLVGPQILRYFIDEALGGSPVVNLVWIAVLFTAVALFQQAVNVVTTYTSGRVGWTATNALRGDLARHCMKLDMSFHNRRTPGEMIERIDGDAEELGGFFSTFVIHILGSTILLAGILVLLFREEWRAGLVLTVFALVVLDCAVQPAQSHRGPLPGGQGG